jgi:hypothetical protein
MTTMSTGASHAPLEHFRAQHRRMGWLYRLLDVGYGVEIAVADVARLSSRAAVVWALAFDAALCALFGLVWWRYDLMSTWHVLDPLGAGLVTAIPKGDWWTVFGGGVDLLVRLIVTLGPSLIQFRMPYLAMRHDAAWLALWATAVFDMATDSVDVRADVPQFFGWLITAASGATPPVWWSLVGLALLLCLVRPGQWPLWISLAGLALYCLAFGQGGAVVYWANVGFWTFFASFAAQSLFLIQLAKCGLLAMKLRAMVALA